MSAEVVRPGTSITCDGSASADPDGDALTFAWDFGDGAQEAEGLPVTEHTFVDPGQFIVQLVVSDVYGATDRTFVEVVVGTITEITPLLIEQHPMSVAVDPGATATFDVRVRGGQAPALQWRKNGVPIVEANGQTLAITGANESHEGLYDCVVRDGGAVVPTRAGRLSVNEPPSIQLHPATQISAVGGSLVFAVFADGTDPLRYQWTKDGADISGATMREHAIEPVQLGDAGNYQVVVSNSAGQATSNVAILTVPAPPMDPTQPAPPVITSRPITTVTVGDLYVYTIATTGAAPMTIRVSGLPGALVFDGATTIRGSPALADIGVYDVTVAASNAVGATEQRFRLEVAVDAPRITSTPPTVARAGLLYDYRIVATGDPAPALSVVGLPRSLAFDGLDTIAGTSTAADIGAHEIVITASSAVGSVNQAFTLEIIGPFGFHETFSDTSTAARPGWSVGGEWEFGVPPVGGGAVASTRLQTNYSNDSHSRLDTPPLDLRGLVDPALVMLHWYDTEPRYDGGRLALSSDGGASFAAVPASAFTAGGYDDTVAGNARSPLAGEDVWAGRISGYTEAKVDLDAALGASPRDWVVLRFEFASDGNTTDLGWSIAFVRIDHSAAPQ